MAHHFTGYYQFILIFNAAAVGQGANTKAINKMEIKILICASTGNPLLAICTALPAKINTGTYNGNTSNDKIMPPRRKPTVNATPMALLNLTPAFPTAMSTTKYLRIDWACLKKPPAAAQQSIMANRSPTNGQRF